MANNGRPIYCAVAKGEGCMLDLVNTEKKYQTYFFCKSMVKNLCMTLREIRRRKWKRYGERSQLEANLFHGDW